MENEKNTNNLHLENEIKDLIGKEDFIEATNLNKYHIELFAGLLMRALKLHKANDLYKAIATQEGLEFLKSFFDFLNIKTIVNEEELARFPKEGAFITVSNHPFGVIDGLLLMRYLVEQNKDFKVMGNFLLMKIERLAPYVIPVNPLENHQDAYSSMAGMKTALTQLRDGKPLGIFPAGEVSSYQPELKTISDRQWQLPAIKLIKRAKVPIVPIYFQGSNSRIFHLIGKLHPLLRTASIPREMFNKKGEEVKIRIGHPISVKSQEDFEDVERFGRFLRAKTYALGSTMEEVKKFYYPSFKFPSKPQEIVQEHSKEKLIQEVEDLKKNNKLLFIQQNYEGYVANSNQIPTILSEIGRLREITFREVGEGTNKKTDLDEFDLYYHHLFIWDKDEHKIVGAYRVGRGDKIIQRFGKKGFYLESLFKMSDEFTPYLEKSLELGRSFITKEYQQKRLPLFLLWKGILFFLLQNPQYRYLIGPVSISSNYTEASRTLIVQFIQRYFYDEKLSELVTPRKAFKPKLDLLDTDALFEGAHDLAQLDKLLWDLEPNRFSVPVLLKKYIQQNAKIISFNLDPKFNNALDGLMILDINEVPEETINNLRKEMELPS
jgi:putative hemolysin